MSKQIKIEKEDLILLISDIESCLGLIGRRTPGEIKSFGTGQEGVMAKMDFLRDMLDARISYLKQLINE